jgi:hypothetical protein
MTFYMKHVQNSFKIDQFISLENNNNQALNRTLKVRVMHI